jgi:hypothetical protein
MRLALKISLGMVPDSLLSDRKRPCKTGREPKAAGIVPDRLLPRLSHFWRTLRLPMQLGMLPFSRF